MNHPLEEPGYLTAARGRFIVKPKGYINLLTSPALVPDTSSVAGSPLFL